MGKKLDMVAQTTKDLNKMCRELGLVMHLVVSDGENMISTAQGHPDKIIHLLGDGICALAEHMGTNIEEVLTHIVVYLGGSEDE
jgi:predicted metal-dependent phosphoesterase TrpH